ncbi:uncharacterized protein ACLA_071970 [Aspergillus clavatus NRRL 1]|uniref:Stc1 domain-containing protein n=1 Tax=Aspergillus clavatus (strain ATCC 1007 / CBS 513.65 / DSM 816 / NCTC 3887 / NRRL 1 / QM 1276 / 107) TaxID=344612 RepID=A1C6Z3_ASPCL|nr:uncharacterized protein ACLA_071970 [Aspergillus clavatus NRRL 1]EAW14164.1 conserved hypothetical protein [Aspergillus clavatus NRRL 1]
MAPTFRSAYAGGYSDEIKKRQLEALRHAILAQGQRVALVKNNTKCRICTRNQTVELRCCVCDKIKGLDDFAKTQRQDRDTARCMNCVQSHAEAAPVLEEHKLLTETEPSTAYDTRTTNPFDEHSLVASTRKLTLRSVPLIAYRGLGQPGKDEKNDDATFVAGSVSVERVQENAEISKDQGPLFFTAYDAQRVAHHRAASPSGAPKSVHTGWASWGVRPDANSQDADPERLTSKKRASKFAKVPGKRFEKHEAPTMRVPEPSGQTMDSDDENDGNDGVEDYL